MKKHMFTILIGVLIVGFGFGSAVYAQSRPNALQEMHMMRQESNLNGDGFDLICSGEVTHPVLMSLAQRYDVEYDDLLDFFCEYKFGVGEIRLALSTAERERIELKYDQILEMRLENGMKQIGWGLIWQELGLIGRGRQNGELENHNDEHHGGAMCSGEMIHPVLMSLVESYGVVYEDLLMYFCDYDFGVGEIRLALNTAERDEGDMTYKDILQMRLEDGTKEIGWGQIWQELGLIGRGRPDQGQDMGEEGRNNKPEFPPGLGGPPPGKGGGPNK